IAIAVNEPQLLADPLRPATKARKRGSSYTLTGEKCLVVRGVDAQKLIVAADAGDGPALFLVDTRAKGVEVRAEPAMGLKATGTARVRFKGVKVPAEQRLAAERFDYQSFLDYTALAWCALAVGTGLAALDYVITYCNEREAFGE
ncbi:acyl-CoA dehydrogenase family protein, partial [Pseudomonas sp. BAgro211]|nr:acyl-CoA dehydrogenase family protein [Pseudomonas sp. BAgro211]